MEPDWKVDGVAEGFFVHSESPNEWKALEGLFSYLYRPSEGLKASGTSDEEDEPKKTLKRLVPLAKILATVRELGCKTVLVEHEYVDMDYRSEYSTFWSRLFEDRPGKIYRLHFFASRVEKDQIHQLNSGMGYLGYSVIRPTLLGPIGRTVICPPGDPSKQVLATVTDRPNLFGKCLEVTGSPFYQQDGVLMRCAHVVAWAAHFQNRHLAGVPRSSTGEIAAPLPGSHFRALPANGLTAEQLQTRLSEIGLPAIHLEVAKLAPHPKPAENGGKSPGFLRKDKADAVEQAARKIARAICPYISSGLSIIVQNNAEHAFTIVGWNRAEHGQLTFITCDDQVGPYHEIRPETTGKRRWLSLLIPVPEKVLLSADPAEVRAVRLFERYFENMEDADSLELLGSAAKGGDGKIRSRLVEGTTYKDELAGRGLSDELVRLGRLSALPHWVWVVELQSHSDRMAGIPCVQAEVVFDSTSYDEDPTAHLVFTSRVAVDTILTQTSPENGTLIGPFDAWSSSIARAPSPYGTNQNSGQSRESKTPGP